MLAYVIALPLEVLVITALLRGEYRRYPMIFIYCVVDLITTVIEIQPAMAARTNPAAMKQWAQIYWYNERIMQVLVFLLVISLVYYATAHMRPRRTLLAAIIGGTALVAAVSFWIHYDPTQPIGRYMTRWTRELNFYGAILDLGLWALLIGSRKKDYKLLLVTGALGIQFTGGAIGQSIRDMSPNLVAVASDLVMVTNFARLYIWYQAFRTKPQPSPPAVST